MRTSLIVASMLCASSAVADELAPVEATRSPGFVNMLRQDATSRGGGELTWYSIDNGGGAGTDVTLLRFDFYGHYVDPSSGAGGYAQLPISYLSDGNQSETALGNIEIGGIYIPRLSSPDFGVVLRGGLVLPSGPDENDEGALVNLLSSFLRPTDLYSSIPKSTSLRLSASPMLRSGMVFARVDLGVDINIDNSDNDDVDPGLVLNAGAGVDFGSAALMGEISNMRLSGNNDSEWINVAALSVRGNAGRVQPYGALLIPLDQDVTDLFNLGITVGVAAAM